MSESENLDDSFPLDRTHSGIGGSIYADLYAFSGHQG